MFHRERSTLCSNRLCCYAAVLHALNYMDKDLLLVAKDDELGRKLQDLELPVRKRVEKNRHLKERNKKDHQDDDQSKINVIDVQNEMYKKIEVTVK